MNDTVHTTCVVIGAGHAGLAMSRRLTERSIDHVVLERGEVANSWRNERWDSLRLLTPNGHTRLPGCASTGHDPAGFMTMPEVVEFITRYADSVAAPVLAGTTVTSVRATSSGYEVSTDRGTWTCVAVVLASGAANIATVPAIAQHVPANVTMHTALTYRSPQQLPGGEVLVVGVSATGVQLADEIHRTGRHVTVAVGEHVRLPRVYRGRDIFWWLDAAGVLDERHHEVDDLVRARHLPSPQLIGTPERRTIDLNTLQDTGVRIVGRLAGIAGGTAQFSGALANVCTLADLKMNRLLDTFDRWAAPSVAECGGPQRFPPTAVPSSPPLQIDLAAHEIRTIIWATGYRADHSWLDVPVFDRKGRIVHEGGVVTASPGLYVLGGNLLRRRRSSYIDGAAADTADLAAHLHGHLDRTTTAWSTSAL